MLDLSTLALASLFLNDTHTHTHANVLARSNMYACMRLKLKAETSIVAGLDICNLCRFVENVNFTVMDPNINGGMLRIFVPYF